MTIAKPLTNASLSTMWALNNYPDLNDFFALSTKLRFGKIELNHQVDSRMLSRATVDQYRFSSIHEPCPSDIPTKELASRDWLISSTDEDARAHAIELVKKSIDLAGLVGAPVVVVHCGTIPFTNDHEIRLRSFFTAGMTNSDEYKELKSEFEHARQSLIAPHLQSVRCSLSELLEYASQARIILGLENRYHYMDIPSIEEMEELLALADPSCLGFVYDVGHAQALDRLGFYPHEAWLSLFSSRMVGCHLHDVIGLVDHYAPGLGEINFTQIARFIPQDAFRTFEMLPGNTLAQVSDSVNVLIKAGCIHYLQQPEEIEYEKIF